MSAPPGWVEAVAATPFSVAIRESELLFPILQTFHIFGTILLAGTIAIVDLRLLRLVLTDIEPAPLARSLLPVTWIGFAVMLASGGLLLTAQAASLYDNAFMRVKLVLLALAIGNVALFHATTFRYIGAWTGATPVPYPARGFAAASLLLWTGVLVTGRFIAYF